MEQEPHNSFTNPSPQTARLIEVLESLEKHIKRQNSLKHALVKGMIYGLGTVIGATILVAILGGLLSSAGLLEHTTLTPANQEIIDP